jgi:hypothetical protein
MFPIDTLTAGSQCFIKLGFSTPKTALGYISVHTESNENYNTQTVCDQNIEITEVIKGNPVRLVNILVVGNSEVSGLTMTCNNLVPLGIDGLHLEYDQLFPNSPGIINGNPVDNLLNVFIHPGINNCNVRNDASFHYYQKKFGYKKGDILSEDTVLKCIHEFILVNPQIIDPNCVIHNFLSNGHEETTNICIKNNNNVDRSGIVEYFSNLEARECAENTIGNNRFNFIRRTVFNICPKFKKDLFNNKENVESLMAVGRIKNTHT